jgi:BirA family biotin operon repressor/biotin-[acetyl-CoA-carboxylase] ligase
VTTRFDVERFRALAAEDRGGIGHAVTAVELTDSTNDDAFAAAAAGAPDGAVFISDAQRAGRGRRGNSWLSEAGEGLLFSVLLKRSFAAAGALLPLAAGLSVRLAVAHRLARAGVSVTPLLKWPNDVLAEGRKLAGILVESRVRGQDEPVTVVGIGLNLGRLPEEICTFATSLLTLGVRSDDREALLFELLGELTRRFQALGETGGADRLVAELNRFDALRGTRVSVGRIVGLASGIDADGCLLITDDRGVCHALRSGHVDPA